MVAVVFGLHELILCHQPLDDRPSCNGPGEGLTHGIFTHWVHGRDTQQIFLYIACESECTAFVANEVLHLLYCHSNDMVRSIDGLLIGRLCPRFRRRACGDG